MSIIISIEGNIGAGKTTIINEINKLTFNKPHIIILEQVQEWMSMNQEILEEENEFGDTAKYVTLDVAVGVE